MKSETMQTVKQPIYSSAKKTPENTQNVVKISSIL